MNFTQIQPLAHPDGLPPLTMPDAPLGSAAIPSGDDGARSAGSDTLGFGAVLSAMNAGGAALERAQNAENAFVSGTGDVQEMVFERAKADTIVSVASAATSRVAQALNTLTQIQL